MPLHSPKWLSPNLSSSTLPATTLFPNLASNPAVPLLPQVQPPVPQVSSSGPPPVPQVQPANTSKAYACASICRSPVLAPAAQPGLGAECADCVADPDVADPWGCTNCLRRFSDAAFDDSQFELGTCLGYVRGLARGSFFLGGGARWEGFCCLTTTI
eukprot:363477-Chlamydomonas_euryale.AAC.8